MWSRFLAAFLLQQDCFSRIEVSSESVARRRDSSYASVDSMMKLRADLRKQVVHLLQGRLVFASCDQELGLPGLNTC